MLRDKILKNEIVTDWIIPIVIALIIMVLTNKFIGFQAIIPSSSMYPTLKVGDRIIVTRIYDTNKLKRGDIIVFYSDELKEELVKRLIGLPGDKVEVNSLGQITVNGIKLDEPYVVNKDGLTGTFLVPKDKYLFMGDNRLYSNDSRRWKNPYIDKTAIKGKARFIYYPFKRLGKFIVGQEAINH